TAKLPEVNGSFFENDEVAHNVMPFLAKYFETYDGTQRDLLGPVYADWSSFSISLSKDITGHELQEYHVVARNLAKFAPDSPEVLRLARGQREILLTRSTLPATQHDIENLTVDAVVISTVTQQPLIQASIQGQFHELKSGLVRSFYRTMVLTP